MATGEEFLAMNAEEQLRVLSEVSGVYEDEILDALRQMETLEYLEKTK